MKKKIKGWLPALQMIAIVLVFWVISNMLTPYIANLKALGYAGAFFISMISSASIILPTPGFLAVFELGSILNPLAVGILAGIGSAIGELTGWWAGRTQQFRVQDWKGYRHNAKTLKKWGSPALFILALAPNPAFDLAGIAAGAAGMPAWKYLLVVGAAKVLKFTFLAYTGLWVKLLGVY